MPVHIARAPLKIEASRQVDPTLGKDAIRSGVKAAIYGTLAGSAFMLIYYLVAGMVANVALIANIIILLGVMCSVGTTLTLPGIAGIILTIGVGINSGTVRVGDIVAEGYLYRKMIRPRVRS